MPRERKLACALLTRRAGPSGISLVAVASVMQDLRPTFMVTISGPLSAPPDSALPHIGIPADRRTLAKRLWRGVAVDGTEFGFQLEQPLQPGDAVFVTATACYRIEQQPEAVLEIPLPTAPDEAAAFGWAVGNLHFPIEAQPQRLLAPDDSALRQSLARAGISFRETREVFRPHRFAAGAKPHSHDHAPAHAEANSTAQHYRFIGRAASDHG